jgi:hypothetical protein
MVMEVLVTTSTKRRFDHLKFDTFFAFGGFFMTKHVVMLSGGAMMGMRHSSSFPTSFFSYYW